MYVQTQMRVRRLGGLGRPITRGRELCPQPAPPRGCSYQISARLARAGSCPILVCAPKGKSLWPSSPSLHGLGAARGNRGAEVCSNPAPPPGCHYSAPDADNPCGKLICPAPTPTATTSNYQPTAMSANGRGTAAASTDVDASATTQPHDLTVAEIVAQQIASMQAAQQQNTQFVVTTTANGSTAVTPVPATAATPSLTDQIKALPVWMLLLGGFAAYKLLEEF